MCDGLPSICPRIAHEIGGYLGSRIAAVLRYSPRQLAGVPEQSGFTLLGSRIAAALRCSPGKWSCHLPFGMPPHPGQPLGQEPAAPAGK